MLPPKNELTSFLGLTEKTNFLFHGCLPVASFVASHLQQLTENLSVEDLKTGNKAFREVRQLSPKILYRAVPLSSPTRYIAFSDASQGKRSNGHTGYIYGILFQTPTELVFHVIDWRSSKQSRSRDTTCRLRCGPIRLNHRSDSCYPTTLMTRFLLYSTLTRSDSMQPSLQSTRGRTTGYDQPLHA